MRTGVYVQRLVALIDDALSEDELKRVVRYALNVPYAKLVAQGTLKKQAVFLVLEYSMDRQLLRDLVEVVITESSARTTELTELLQELERRLAVSPAAANGAAIDPLARFLPAGVPFVDRKSLVDKLDELWDQGQSGVLVVRGERYSGRTHSWWRIVEAAKAAHVVFDRVDVSRNPGTWTVADIVERVVGFLKVDRRALKDSLAQGAAQGRALIAAMVEQTRDAGLLGERACIVFDGLDRPGVDGSIIELVEQMISTVAEGLLPGLSLIILGYGDHSDQPFGWRIHSERIDPIGPTHVFEWLSAALDAAGVSVPEKKRISSCETILDGFTPPYDARKMDTLRDRARCELRALLKGQKS